MAGPFTYFQNRNGKWFARDQYGNVSDVGNPYQLDYESMPPPPGASAVAQSESFAPPLPYSSPPSIGSSGSMGDFGTTTNFGFPSSFDLGGPLPSATTPYLGIPGGVNSAGSMSVGGDMTLGPNDFSLGGNLPPSPGAPFAWDYTPSGAGPGSMSTGGDMTLGGDFTLGGNLPPPGIPFAWDYTPSGPGALPGAGSDNFGSMNVGGTDIWDFMSNVMPNFQGLPATWDFGPEPGSMNIGGTDIASFGAPPDFSALSASSDALFGSPPDFSFLPPSSDVFLGFGGTDTGGAPSGTPAPAWSEPDALPGTETPAQPAGDVTVETPTDPSSPGTITDNPFADPSWLPPEPVSPPPDQPAPVTPDGTQLPSGGGTELGGGIPLQFTSPSIFLGGPGMGVPFGVAPSGGVFQGGTFIPAGGSLGTSFGPSGFSIVGQPGTNQYLGSGQTFSTAVGMFGLGAMNAPGGSFSLGMGGPESGIAIRTQGDAPDFAFGKAANEAAKLGMSVDDYMAMMDSAAVGPTAMQIKAMNDPYKFWESRILQSRRMASAGSGSQPSGPIGIDPTYSIDAARNAGMYKGWTFDPATGTFVPPTAAAPTAQPSKGSNK